MRWQFGVGEAQRAEKLREIDAWWTAFAGKTGALDAYFKNEQQWDLAQWMQNNLQAIDGRIMWEFGPGLQGGHRLVITPEVDRHLRPLVNTILQRAPKLKGWEFYSYRLAESADEAEAMLKARGLMSLAGATVVVSPGDHHQIDLVFYSRDFSGPQDQNARNATFVASEVILGEKILDTWVGVISVDKAPKPGPGAIRLNEMKVAVDQRIAAIKAELPENHAWEMGDDANWTMWDLKPQKREDYAGQFDLFVGKSMFPDMWGAAHSGAVFSSERFSMHGELFCYVKIDGSVDLTGEKFEDKAQIEDALDATLKKSKVGAVIGGGTGLRYSYVDLALTDPEAGIRQVVNVLRDGNITKRAWILFFDDIYEHEWVGVWDDSPPPPGLEAR